MVDFDFRDFERAARSLNAFSNQVPFALARALNDSAELARSDLPQTWAEHITVRNPRFLKAALSTKGTRATKARLSVEIYDRLGRANLFLHDQGGSRKPRGAAIAVPSKALQAARTSKGVPKGLRPRAIPNSFVKGDVLYQRTGKGKNRGLKLMYVLRPQTRISPDVPFHREFDRIMRREVPRQFGVRLEQAMKTAFRQK